MAWTCKALSNPWYALLLEGFPVFCRGNSSLSAKAKYCQIHGMLLWTRFPATGAGSKILAEHFCLEPVSSQATLVTVLVSPTTLHELPKGQWQRGPCLCPQLPPCSPPSLCCPGAWCCCRCSQVTLELQPSVPGQPGILYNASLQLTSWGNACLSQRVTPAQVLQPFVFCIRLSKLLLGFIVETVLGCKVKLNKI